VLKRIAAALLVAGALLAAAGTPASALAPRQYPPAEAYWVSPQTGQSECFGKTGTFKRPSRVWRVDWNWSNPRSWDECFGIAPNRAIYHIWPASGRWVEMPNGGRADDVANLFINENGYRTVQVVVSASGALYCSHLVVGWTAWYRC